MSCMMDEEGKGESPWLCTRAHGPTRRLNSNSQATQQAVVVGCEYLWLKNSHSQSASILWRTEIDWRLSRGLSPIICWTCLLHFHRLLHSVLAPSSRGLAAIFCAEELSWILVGEFVRAEGVRFNVHRYVWYRRRNWPLVVATPFHRHSGHPPKPLLSAGNQPEDRLEHLKMCTLWGAITLEVLAQLNHNWYKKWLERVAESKTFIIVYWL